MISVFYASISIIATALVGLLLGARIGIKLYTRAVGTMDKMMQRPEYRNTAGAVWVLTELDGKLRDGVTLEQLRAWVDARGDDIAAGFESRPEMGEALVQEWNSVGDDARKGTP